MAFSQYALCIDCQRGYTRRNGAQKRCPACQAEYVLVNAREHKRQYMARRRAGQEKREGPDEYFYVIVNDPLQPEWHGRITYQSVTEGLRQATFSEGTVLRYGRVKFKVVGAAAPYPFMRAAEAQRLEEL